VTKPRRRRTDPTCRKKRRYADEVSARAVGAQLLKERGVPGRRWVYRCKHCDGWHVTSKGNGTPSLTADQPVRAK